ncbi:MAG: hypothetical protein ACR2MS_01645 [Weeksellaceae bacterium]
MKRIYLFTVLFVCTLCSAQVGINTDSPAATLDVKNDPKNPNQLEGIIAPRITGTLLRAKTYTAAQNGALVFITAPDTAPGGQTINITTSGYYYFDAPNNVWVALRDSGKGKYHKFRTTSAIPIQILPEDYTIGYTGTASTSVTLPPASAHPQRIIKLCTLNWRGGTITINNMSSTQFEGNNPSSIISFNLNGTQACYEIQSDGNAWYVIGSFK